MDPSRRASRHERGHALKLVAAVLLLALVGCGGGGESYEDTEALADAIGCKNHKISSADTMSLGARETGTCDSDSGRDLSLAVFKSNDARDTFVEGVGALGGTFVVGEKWAVGAQTDDDAQAVADEISGAVLR